MANVELCIKPVLQANIVDQKREAIQTNETLKSSEIMVKSRCSNLTNKHDPCTSGPLQLISLILTLEEWAHQPPKCFLCWSCGAVRQELHVRKSGRKADDLQTSKLRHVDSVDSGPWLRSPPPCDVGALASPWRWRELIQLPNRQAIHFSFGWGMMSFDVSNVYEMCLPRLV